MLCAYRRESCIGAAKHSAPFLKLLVRRLRQAWPAVRIPFRGDSGFYRQCIIHRCERSGVSYIIGLARNARLQAITELMELAMKDRFERTCCKQREVGEFIIQSLARTLPPNGWQPKSGQGPVRLCITRQAFAAQQY